MTPSGIERSNPLAFSTVPQPTAPPFGPVGYDTNNRINREEGRIKSFRRGKHLRGEKEA